MREGFSEGEVTTDGSLSERIRCGQCEVRADSVAAIHDHHSTDHPHLRFLWIDCSNGYTCSRSGEVRLYTVAVVVGFDVVVAGGKCALSP